MKAYKKAGILGILISFGDILYNIYIVRRLPFPDPLLPELVVIAIKSFFYLAPGIALLIKKNIGFKYNWLPWTYPLILALGLLNVYTAEGPLGSGLPMVGIVFPFCIIFTIIVLAKNKMPK